MGFTPHTLDGGAEAVIVSLAILFEWTARRGGARASESRRGVPENGVL